MLTSAGVRSPDVAVAPDGTVVAIWIRRDPATSKEVLQAVVRPPGGPVGPVQDLSPPLTGSFKLDDADVAMDASGGATVIWSQAENAGVQAAIWSAVRPPGGSFGAPQRISASETEFGKDTFIPRLTVNAAGAAVAVWRKATSVCCTVVEAAVRPAGGAFGPPEPISGTGANNPDAAIDAGGNALVVWERFNGVRSVIEAAAKPLGGPWTAQVAPSVSRNTTGDALQPEVAIEPGGRAVAVWQHDLGADPGDLDEVHFASRPITPSFGGAAFEPPGRASEQNVDTFTPDVAVDADDTAVAVWLGKPLAEFVVQGAVRPSGGSFVDVRNVSGPAGSDIPPRVAIGASGDAVASWLGSVSGEEAAQAAIRPEGGTFGAVETLEVGDATSAIARRAPRAALDGGGNGADVWIRRVGSGAAERATVRLAGHDAMGPQLRSLTVPATGTAGQPVAFSVEPLDVWSAFTTTWAFGDGATATGNSPAHAYAGSGAFAVTVTSTDAVGNTSTGTRSVNVAAPTPPDRDGDGFDVTRDCDDTNPLVHPRAPEIRGNRQDENCDGQALPFRSSLSPVQSAGFAAAQRTVFTRLRVLRAPARSKVQLRCRGPRCTAARRVVRSRRGGTVDLVKRFGRRGRLVFRRGQTIQVRVIAPGMVGKVVRYRIVKNKFPAGRTLCVPVGAERAQRRC